MFGRSRVSNGMARQWQKARRAAGCEEGGITVLALFMFMIMLVGAGFAIDVNNATQARVQLQGAADAAGHAAIYWRHRNSESAAEARGVQIAQANMPTSLFGEVLATADIEFGDWDSVDRTFTPSAGDRSAVRVTTRRIAGRSNGVATFLLKLIGYDELNLNTVSVWDAGDGFCQPRSPDKKRGEGFFARGIVDIQSGNDYYDGFCIHSQTHVEFNQNNTFEDGVTVSMPDQSDLVIPASGFTRNEGLQDALTSMSYNLTTFFNDLPTLIANHGDPLWSGQPSYITDTSQVYTQNFKKNDKIKNSDLQANAVNLLTCTGGQLTFANGTQIENVVIVTDCDVKFNNGATLQNATIAMSDPNSSFSTPSGFRIGASNYCSTGTGGATILTMGDFSTTANFEAYGANVVAAGDISVTSGADGLAGVNFMAGGRIDARSNGDLGFCNEGPPQAFDIPVFRMAG